MSFRITLPSPAASIVVPTASPRPTALRTLSLRAIALLAAVLLAALGLFAASPAQAHDQLESSNPKDGAVLTKQPEFLTMNFSDKVQSTGTEIKVMHGGKDVSAGEVTVKGSKVMSALPDDLGSGKYTVVWRVVSADGHPVSGDFDFTIKDGNGAGGTVTGSAGASSAGAGSTSENSAGLGAVSGGAVDQNAQSASSSVSAPVIVLIVVGVVAVVAIVVLLFWRKSKGLGTDSK